MDVRPLDALVVAQQGAVAYLRVPSYLVAKPGRHEYTFPSPRSLGYMIHDITDTREPRDTEMVSTLLRDTQ